MRLIQVNGIITYQHQGEDAVRHAKRLDRAYGVMEEFGYGPGPHIAVIETNAGSYPYHNATTVWVNRK